MVRPPRSLAARHTGAAPGRVASARAPVAVAAVLTVLVLTSCEVVTLSPAPPPSPPAAPAVPGTWRAEAEAWVADTLFPAVLGRSPAQSSAIAWADLAVRSSPATAARSVAATGEARRRAVRWAFPTALGRSASPGDQAYWAGRLASGWTYHQLLAHLLGSAEVTARFPAAADWAGWLYGQVLGRAADPGALDDIGARLFAGTSRSTVARGVVASLEARRRVAEAVGADVLGRAPSASERDAAAARLAATGGDELGLRGHLAVGRAPAGYRVGVVGDSVAFGLGYWGQRHALPAVIADSHPILGGVIGCGVLSSQRGLTYWTIEGWRVFADGSCVSRVATVEASMLAGRPQVVVWPIGAIEATAVRRADGRVIPARSSQMRDELAAEMVRRIDRFVAAGVRKVSLPEWACPGTDSPAFLREPAYIRWVRTVLDEVVRRRPTVASVPVTPPQVCEGGDPTGLPTAEHHTAMLGEYHWRTRHPERIVWVDGAGAAWGWTWWFAPAVADIPGVR